MKNWKSLAAALVALVGTILFAGCATTTEGKSGGSDTNQFPAGVELALNTGELIDISFSDVIQPISAYQGRIKEDGTITLMENQQFKAAGKTTGQLESEIRERYVPSYYKNLTVTVKVQDRFFYVEGQVRMPSRQEYRSHITVQGAIAAAGGANDFANVKKILVIRSNNSTQVVNLEKAKTNPKLDLTIYPNDRIIVPRKVW